MCKKKQICPARYTTETWRGCYHIIIIYTAVNKKCNPEKWKFLQIATPVHLPPCTRNNAHTNTRCCHNNHNEIFIILTSDFSQEINVLPDDDMRLLSEHAGAVKVF
jgi:hypothetical protein